MYTGTHGWKQRLKLYRNGFLKVKLGIYLLSDVFGQVNAELKSRLSALVPYWLSICSDHPILHLFLIPFASPKQWVPYSIPLVLAGLFICCLISFWLYRYLVICRMFYTLWGLDNFSVLLGATVVLLKFPFLSYRLSSFAIQDLNWAHIATWRGWVFGWFDQYVDTQFRKQNCWFWDFKCDC